jgi:predicted YcjX-like family ATPase
MIDLADIKDTPEAARKRQRCLAKRKKLLAERQKTEAARLWRQAQMILAAPGQEKEKQAEALAKAFASLLQCPHQGKWGSLSRRQF